MSNKSVNNISLVNIPNSVDNAIKNLTDKPTKSIGDTFNDFWYLVFGRISQRADEQRLQFAHDLQAYKDALTDKIHRIPSENRIAPSFQVTAQALENSKYCISSEELRSLFVNLISSSMDSSYKSNIHPSFAEIIKQMSPFDALLLREFPTTKFSACPTVDYVSTDISSKKYRIDLHNVIFPRLTDFDVFQISKSVSSLNRFGLIAIDKTLLFSDTNAYDVFLQTDYYTEQTQLAKLQYPKCQFEVKKYVSYLTPLGKDFVSACMHP